MGIGHHLSIGSSIQGKTPFPWDLEKVIDDWILMGFLVGNDFIPHLPHLHIHHDALPLLWRTYKTVLPSLDGNSNWSNSLLISAYRCPYLSLCLLVSNSICLSVCLSLSLALSLSPLPLSVFHPPPFIIRLNH